ncbi:MAG: GntR family transcriptional regulator [Flintibacter sp.]|uniref:GntR family transcriptional regulator n=1 Tax=Flintibacter sp. TaxID=1918624 RepID=UPI002671ACB9|nr:GntR family transcriptional regulator [Flintibacter sp.]MCI6150637.1 GntR family transcriptional regulator [Flintibacter sp.]MDD7115110.1 GntR family transcriptional regulator [Flintibacter sp.]MDY5038443.1 GntR family transcriptional regulator [Lawsonibacter sp.]
MGNELFGGRDVGNTPSFKEQAYALIKDAILFNRFRVGAIYSQEAICTELGISRTPVREALLELQKDGYVSFCRGKGVQVVPVSQTMAHDILEARLYAERVNAELAAVRATQQERDYLVQTLKDLQENLEGRDGQLLYRVDHRFHRGVAAAAHNQLMYRQSEVLLDHYLRFEVKSVYNNSIDGKIVFEEHVAILDAIQSGNGERAKQAMEKHLTNSYRRTVSQFWP